ncbi:MAG: helix-turn-helix domain-containing protein [Deltaproteobacteria bacterium]|nr:helix-turn-helix domain-containing protein [Kofleriaceae bacterium]
MELNKLMRLEDAASRLGKSLSTVRRLIRAGDLNVVVVLGRVVVHRDDVERFRTRLGAR